MTLTRIVIALATEGIDVMELNYATVYFMIAMLCKSKIRSFMILWSISVLNLT